MLKNRSIDEEPQKERLPQDSSALSKLKRRLFDLRANEDGFLYDTEDERVQRTEKAINVFINLQWKINSAVPTLLKRN